MKESEICEAMGYLSNPAVAMHYDVQVPPVKQAEFETNYRNLTGIPPCAPGSGGYSVLGKSVDKRAVQYRISYSPAGSVPSYLQSISKSAPGSSGRMRISNKKLLLEMFRSGFVLGSPPPEAELFPGYLVPALSFLNLVIPLLPRIRNL